MSDEKVIIDLCSSEEEEDNFADENCFPEELDQTEEEEEEDTTSLRYFFFPTAPWLFIYLSIFDSACFLVSEDDSDWGHDDATDSDVDFDIDNETGKKGHAAAAAADDDDDDKVTRLLTGS